MREAWRIVKEKHAATAFSGEGAAKAGGRWNSRGTPVVYASASRSLAALENLVHLNPPVRFKYAAFRVEFSEAYLEAVALESLPSDWRAEPPPPSTRLLGDEWVGSQRSIVLAVPSVIIPGELNFLINPNHPEFSKLIIHKPEPFGFDPRLFK